MPRILRILNRFNLGGPSYNAAYLTKYLGQEFETLLIGGLKNDDEDSSEFIFHNFGVTPLIIEEMRRPLNLLEDRKAYKRIRKIIAEFQPDIVHTHAAKAGALGRMAAFSKKVPVVVHTFHGHVFHSYFGRAKTEMFKLFERRMSARTDAIVAISETQKRELTLDHRICDEDKVHVIPLGFDLDRFQQDRDEKRKAF
ncbi:MAG: glycosyltransferase, partial [Flavobacteriales bacterium]